MRKLIIKSDVKIEKLTNRFSKESLLAFEQDGKIAIKDTEDNELELLEDFSELTDENGNLFGVNITDAINNINIRLNTNTRRLNDNTDVLTQSELLDNVLCWDGTKYVNKKLSEIPIIASLLNSFELKQKFLGGSSNNLSNQSFTVNLNDTPFNFGDVVVLSEIEFRGDFSGANENVTMSTNQSTQVIGGFASNDTSVWQSQPNTTLNATIQDVGLGQKGIIVNFTPTNAVNFAPSGMSNWWEIRSTISKQ